MKAQKAKPRKGRKQDQGQKPNPITAPLTPRQLRKETRAATRQEYRPMQREIQGELRASNQRVGQVGDWWNDYLQQVSGIQADTQGAYNNAAAQTQGFIGQSSALDSANTQRLQAEAAQSAALRGATPDTNAAQTEAASQAQRNYLSSAYGSATAQRGANQYAYLGDQKRIGAGQKIASQTAEQKRGLSIRQDLRELAKSKGDFKTRYRADARASERAYLLEQGKQAAYDRVAGLKSRDSAADNARSAASDAETRRHNRAGEADSGASGGRTPSQRRDDRKGAKEAMTAAQTLYSAAGRPRWSGKDWTLFIQRVAMEDGIGYAEAKRAVAKLKKKSASKPKVQPNAPRTPGFNP